MFDRGLKTCDTKVNAFNVSMLVGSKCCLVDSRFLLVDNRYRPRNTTSCKCCVCGMECVAKLPKSYRKGEEC